MKIRAISPRGMRDFLPEEMILREEILSKIKRSFLLFGFQPISTPAVEYLKVLRAKCGEEIGGQIFEFDDMGLRFEFTAGLARLASNISVPKPFKVYQIGPIWRRDEPQRGRYREFIQADIDIIGSDSMKCEAELLGCTCLILNEIGITDYKIRINNIKTLNDILEKAGIKENKKSTVMRSLDKLKKKKESEVKDEMIQNGIDKKSIEALFKMISKPLSSDEFEGLDEINGIISLSEQYGMKDIEIDYSLARGLAYYTGPIFEIEAIGKDGKGIGSIGGGGRYNNLLEIYGSPSPAVGVSLGVERIIEILKSKSEKSKAKKDILKTKLDVFVAVVGDESYQYAIKVATKLRTFKLNTAINTTDKSLKRQLDYANALSIPYVFIIGEEERKKRNAKIKNLKTGKEKTININKLEDFIGMLSRKW